MISVIDRLQRFYTVMVSVCARTPPGAEASGLLNDAP